MPSKTPVAARPLRGWHFASPLDIVPPTSPPDLSRRRHLTFVTASVTLGGMANVTVTIRLRRRIADGEGRNPVNINDLTAALIEELESSVLDTEFAVTDSAGDDATYEVTALRAVRRDEPMADAEPMNSCAVCGAAIVSDPHGRPRLYCGATCRQIAHRARTPAN